MTRVALLADLLEEKWPSMDLVAEELHRSMNEEATRNPDQGQAPESWTVDLIRPPLRRRFSKAQTFAGRGFTIDRLLNRFVTYPRSVRKMRSGFDFFHLADHSYSQLVHELPGNRTVVTCHDLDTFRCLWETRHGGRGPLFVAMTRRILSGLRKAAHVCCDSEATLGELLDRGLMPRDRVSVVRLGLRPGFTGVPNPVAEQRIDDLLRSSTAPTVDFLHVGSTIPRKRIDVLLEVFARIKAEIEPRARLLRVGGSFTAAQQEQCGRLGLRESVLVLPFLSTAELAAVYRRAVLVLLPSEAEGFGLPVIEALACGAPVLASDLPVLREVGDTAAAYAPVADTEVWLDQVRSLMQERGDQPDLWEQRRERCRLQGSKFSWEDAARQTLAVYRHVLSQAGGRR